MIPYFVEPVWHLGGIAISASRVADAVGLCTGYFIVLWRARIMGVDQSVCSRYCVIFAIAGMIGGHIAALWPLRANISNAWGWSEIWNGQSADGLAAGAGAVLVAAYFTLARRGLDPLLYLNVLAFAFPFAWTLARLGCALAHDHIGPATSSILAVHFPSGARFDLGLLECLASAVLSACFFAARRIRGNVFLPLLLVAVVAVRTAIHRLAITS